MHPDHGTVEPYNSTVPFPESARYTCDDGYSITGDTTRTCQSHGGWDGSEPSCNEIGTASFCEVLFSQIALKHLFATLGHDLPKPVNKE